MFREVKRMPTSRSKSPAWVFAALALLRDAWDNPGLEYSDRVDALRISTGGGPALDLSRVYEDNAVDEVFGGADSDWFWTKTEGPLADAVNDWESPELKDQPSDAGTA